MALFSRIKVTLTSPNIQDVPDPLKPSDKHCLMHSLAHEIWSITREVLKKLAWDPFIKVEVVDNVDCVGVSLVSYRAH